MSRKDKAVVVLVSALVVGAIAQGVARREAAALGLTHAELALAGLVVGGVATRVVAR